MKRKIEGLYAVIDTTYVELEDIERTASVILDAGVRIIQLRAKGIASGDILKASKTLRGLTAVKSAAFIVNDRVDIALITGADGVHLGQDDIPLKDARKLLGAGSVIGISTHNPEEATEAQAGGADYISFGPIFSTRTKKDAQSPRGLSYLAEIRRKVAIPIVAIGGITEENAAEVIKAGADSVAVISDILLSEETSAKTSSIISRIKGAADA